MKITGLAGRENKFTGLTIAELWRPFEKKSAILYDIALIMGGSLFIALCAQFAVGWPIPITGQTFAVLLIGALLGARRGSLCILAYITEGMAGLPVFAHAQVGAQVLAKSFTVGYIVGFVPAAFLVGLLAEKGWDRRAWTTVLGMALGNIVIYTFGVIWISYLWGIHTALTKGLYPFIVGDCLKIALAAALLPSAWKLLSKANLPEKN